MRMKEMISHCLGAASLPATRDNLKEMNLNMTRRAAMTAAAAGALQAQSATKRWQPSAEMVEAHDRYIDSRLKSQITTKGHRFYGGFPDADGLVHGGASGGALHTYGLGYILSQSRHHKSPLMLERMR